MLLLRNLGNMERNQLVVDREKAFRVRYKLRKANTRGDTLESTIPTLVVQRKARQLGMTIDEFIEAHLAEWSFDDFDGLFLEFVPKEHRSENTE